MKTSASSHTRDVSGDIDMRERLARAAAAQWSPDDVMKMVERLIRHRDGRISRTGVEMALRLLGVEKIPAPRHHADKQAIAEVNGTNFASTLSGSRDVTPGESLGEE